MDDYPRLLKVANLSYFYILFTDWRTDWRTDGHWYPLSRYRDWKIGLLKFWWKKILNYYWTSWLMTYKTESRNALVTKNLCMKIHSWKYFWFMTLLHKYLMSWHFQRFRIYIKLLLQQAIRGEVQLPLETQILNQLTILRAVIRTVLSYCCSGWHVDTKYQSHTQVNQLVNTSFKG